MEQQRPREQLEQKPVQQIQSWGIKVNGDEVNIEVMREKVGRKLLRGRRVQLGVAALVLLFSATSFAKVKSCQSTIAAIPSGQVTQTVLDPDVQIAKKRVIEAEIKRQALANGAAGYVKWTLTEAINSDPSSLKKSLELVLKKDVKLSGDQRYQLFTDLTAVIAFDVAEYLLLGVKTMPPSSEKIMEIAKQISNNGEEQKIIQTANNLAVNLVNSGELQIFVNADSMISDIAEHLRDATDEFLMRQLNSDQEDDLFLAQFANKEYISSFDNNVVRAKGEGVKLGYVNLDKKQCGTPLQKAQKSKTASQIGIF